MDGVHKQVANLLETFTTLNRCFTPNEVSEWSDGEVEPSVLEQELCRDSRFILLNQPNWDLKWFLPETTMFRWWSNFSLRLSHILQPRLSELQLAASLNSLHLDGQWTALPVGALSYGKQFGFVAPAWTPGFYVFPVAHLLAKMSPMGRRTANPALASFATPDLRNEAMKQPMADGIGSVFPQSEQRANHIVKAREGLPPYAKMTLEELGKVYGCTRERIRQIESKFWKRVQHPRRLSSLVAVLLAEQMRRRGSLVLDSHQEDMPFVRFVCKCLGVPHGQTNFGDLVLLGVSDFDTSEVVVAGAISEASDPYEVAAHLESGPLSFLPRSDLRQIATAISQVDRSRLTKQEKVYLALKDIGRHAHASEVTETYNTLFSDDQMTQRNIHAILSRCASPRLEQYGIVWVGARSTYALKEHGYERPAMGIFEAVAKVVEDKFKETQKPVHVAVITAELGKYRQIVKSASLAIAIGVNPCIEPVGKDLFVPKDSQNVNRSEDTADELDRILRQFRDDHSGGS